MKDINNSSTNLTTHKKMKYDTLLSILHAIREGHKTKRSIQKLTGISWASCSENINNLNKQGIIIIDASVPEEIVPGPRTTSYKFSTKQFLIMGMEITSKSIMCSISNLGNELLLFRTFIQTKNLNNKNIYQIITKTFYNAISIAGVSEESIISLTFALTGALDRDNLVWIKSPKVLNISNINFNFFLETLPFIESVFIEHDIIARSVNIQSTNVARPSSFALLHIADGMGLSVMMNGEYYLGSRGLATEIGHIPCHIETDITPSSCFCDQHHCLESFLSLDALSAYIKSRYKISITTIKDIEKKLTREQLGGIYREIEKFLLHSCILIVNLFDPEFIFIGGRVIELWKLFIEDSFLKTLQQYTWLNGPKNIVLFEEEYSNPSFGAACKSSFIILDHIIHSINK